MELLNISSQLMLLVVPLIPSTFLLAMELVISALFDIKLAMITCFFFIVKEENELWVPASNTNTFGLFDDTIE